MVKIGGGMNLSDVVGYCNSNKARIALLIPDKNISILGWDGSIIDSSVAMTEDQVDNIALSPLDTAQTSELNENGYTSIDLAIGDDHVGMDIYIESGKIRLVIEIIKDLTRHQVYNYPDFQIEISKKINKSFCSVVASSDGLSEQVFLSSILKHCSDNNLNLVTIGVNTDNLLSHQSSSDNMHRAVLDLGNSAAFMYKSGFINRFANSKNILLINADHPQDKNLLKRIYIQASKGFNKLIFIFRFNDYTRFNGFFSSISNNFYLDQPTSIFCEGLSLKVATNSEKCLMLLGGQTGDNEFAISQFSLLVNDRSFTIESIKALAEQSSVINYKDIIDTI